MRKDSAYLFSLAVRLNPFNLEAFPTVTNWTMLSLKMGIGF